MSEIILPDLPLGLKSQRGLIRLPFFTLKRDEFIEARHRLAMALEQLRLIVPRFEMAARSRAEYHQYVLGFGGEVRLPWQIRMFW